MIDEFPVWNPNPYSAMMMRDMACPEREKVSEPHKGSIEMLMIARRNNNSTMLVLLAVFIWHFDLIKCCLKYF